MGGEIKWRLLVIACLKCLSLAGSQPGTQPNEAQRVRRTVGRSVS